MLCSLPLPLLTLLEFVRTEGRDEQRYPQRMEFLQHSHNVEHTEPALPVSLASTGELQQRTLASNPALPGTERDLRQPPSLHAER